MKSLASIAGVLVVLCGCREPARRSSEGGAGSARGEDAGVPVPEPDVVVDARKTAAGGEVLEIGKPRLRVRHDFIGPLVVRSGARRAFAHDGGDVKIWELEHGTLIRRIALPLRRGERLARLVVSPDGTWLATGSDLDLQIAREPFTQLVPTGRELRPMAIAPDGREVLGTYRAAAAVGAAAPYPVATAPALAKSLGFSLALAQQGSTVYWVMEDGLAQWNRATGETKIIAEAARPWSSAAIALGAPVALVADREQLYRLDLESGVTERIATRARARSGIAPSGRRVALVDNTVEVVDLPATRVASIVPRVAASDAVFSESDDVLAFADDGEIQIHDVKTGRWTFGQPSRFERWIGEGIAQIERGGVRTQLAVATRAQTAAAATPAPTSAPPEAPAWATVVTTAPDGAIVATAPLPAASRPFDRRQGSCPPTFDVWTPAGGTRTLTFRPTESQDWTASDPCWVVVGRRVVAASAEQLTIFDAVTGKRTGSIAVGAPPERVTDDTFRHQYWAVVGSPTGAHLALWWRRADMWPPPGPEREPEPHECEPDERQGGCLKEYFAELWAIDGAKPVRRWRHRPDTADLGSRRWPYSKAPSGAIAFTHDGRHVLYGFDDGEIWIHSLDAAAPIRIERLHRDAITRIDVSPGDGYVLTEDEVGEQRIWPLGLP